MRPNVPALDNILGQKFPVLDDGFIRVVDYMGDDVAIVQAARVSYGEGTKKVSEDRGLIRYLMRHHHTTPFEMAEIKLHVRVPMDCWRQWIRTRTANVNETSTRYSIAIDSTQQTEPERWRLQSKDNKQGSQIGDIQWPEPIRPQEREARERDLTPGEYLSQQEIWLQECAREVYERRLAFGVAREQARKDLPLSTYTEAIWKIDLHNLLHFLHLRKDPHAQWEIRQYANTIGDIVKLWVPLVWEAFESYRMNAVTFSQEEMEALKFLIYQTEGQTPQFIAENICKLSKREAAEFLAKLNH